MNTVPTETDTPTGVHRIEIVPHQERWVQEFRQIGRELRAGLGDLALRIDHIGSTSVPGLAAKDLIDVQVTVAALEPLQAIVDGFTAAGGYRLRPQNTWDHRPPGDTHPDEHWQKRFFAQPEGRRRINVHVRVAGRANQRYALLFRDFLRTNAPAMGGYEAAKRELARFHPHDAHAYVTIKDPICDIIIAGAELWAASSGWQPGPSDA